MEEDLLKAGLAAREADHPCAGDRRHERLECAAEQAGGSMISDDQLVQAFDALQAVHRHLVGEIDLHAECTHADEVFEWAHRREVSLAHDADAIAHMLDFGQHV